MNIKQGDIFWISPNELNKIASDYTHPNVIIEDKSSSLVTVCSLTSNLKRAKEPGNILLDKGEANLPEQSVIEVAKIFTVDKKQLGEYVGTLNEKRIKQILTGIRFLQIMTQHHE